MALTKITDKQVTYKQGSTGSVVRNLGEKLRESVSVKDFGAFNRSSVLTYFRDATQEKYESSRFFRYACRVMWLWRNGGYGFAYNIFGRTLDEELWVKERGIEKQGFWYKWTQRKSSFQFKANIPTPWFWYLNINIGWKTHKGFPRAMYAGRLIGSGA